MVYREKIKLQSRDRAVSFHDVTEQVKEAVKRSGVKDGIAVVYSHHTTCSVIASCAPSTHSRMESAEIPSETS